MATKKPAVAVDAELLAAMAEVKPAIKVMTSADRNFLKGLKRRGYTVDQIISIAKKGGFTITEKDLEVKAKKKPAAPATPSAAPARDVRN